MPHNPFEPPPLPPAAPAEPLPHEARLHAVAVVRVFGGLWGLAAAGVAGLLVWRMTVAPMGAGPMGAGVAAALTLGCGFVGVVAWHMATRRSIHPAFVLFAGLFTAVAVPCGAHNLMLAWGLLVGGRWRVLTEVEQDQGSPPVLRVTLGIGALSVLAAILLVQLLPFVLVAFLLE